MSDAIKHECGLAMVRLLKPLDFYQKKYGSAFYGLNKVQLLLQKMRNRGQDGAGIATVKLDTRPGQRYISRKRTNDPAYLKHLIDGIHSHFKDCTPEQLTDPQWLKANKPYMGEVLIGHVRYGTHGSNSIETVHPFIRQNNYITKNLILAGNFNLTNVDQLFGQLVELGQYPKEKSDTVTILEKIGHFLDDEVAKLYTWFKPEGYSNQEINTMIMEHLDVNRVLQRAARKFDGGFVIGGILGHGDAFVFRDPAGIRPAYYYQDEEIVVVASERPAIMTAIGVAFKDVKELKRGHSLIIKKNGVVKEQLCIDQHIDLSCSFERIYFARGTDRDIYLERKKLGELLVPAILKEIDNDYKNSIFSFIPNTAEVSFFGMIEGLDLALNKIKQEKILSKGDKLTPKTLDNILKMKTRVEKIVVKDAKMRTFIADKVGRAEMVSHVYDVTYGIVKNGVDTLVLIDDSIVRGTTLKDSIIQTVERLHPKHIVIVSSAPQIRYPDCYGIDMSMMKEFVAFRALVRLLKENGKSYLLDEVYQKCKKQYGKPDEEIKNYVKELYDQFSYQEVSDMIGAMITPPNIQATVKVIYQTIDNLHLACPNSLGDWYFSGDYPTPGGNRVVNKAFINYMEGKEGRGY